MTLFLNDYNGRPCTIEWTDGMWLGEEPAGQTCIRLPDGTKVQIQESVEQVNEQIKAGRTA